MRKVIVSMNVTLDGFIAGCYGELDWHFPFWNEEMAQYALEQLRTSDTILVGRITYQTMASYWPTAPPDDFALLMNHHVKIVFSTTLKKTRWYNAKLATKNIATEVSQLKQLPGLNIIVYGSGSIVQALTDLDLVDEYRIWIHPVVLGSGTPFFKQLHPRFKLQLINTRTFRSGVVVVDYRTREKEVCSL